MNIEEIQQDITPRDETNDAAEKRAELQQINLKLNSNPAYSRNIPVRDCEVFSASFEVEQGSHVSLEFSENACKPKSEAGHKVKKSVSFNLHKNKVKFV